MLNHQQVGVTLKPTCLLKFQAAHQTAHQMF